MNYKVISKIGEGGMAEVFKVEINGRFYALKRLKIPQGISVEDEIALRTSFHQEANILCFLRHPNIVKGINYFTLNGSQELLMELLEGTTLDNLILQTKLSEEEARDIIVQVGEALSYLHSLNPPIIHRDIKPQNIFVCKDKTVKLLDLGIFKSAKRARMKKGDVNAFGTPGYAPPEQYNGYTDQRSDVYALGATLYTILTRTVPPEAPDRAQNDTLFIRSHISNPMRKVIEKALALSPSQRFSSVREMVDSLREIT